MERSGDRGTGKAGKTAREGTCFQERFGVGGDTLSRVIGAGLAAGGDFAEVYLQHRTSDDVGFEDGDVNQAGRGVDLGAGIRVLAGDQTGYAFTESLDEESMIRAARTAAAVARSSDPRKPSPLVEVPVQGGLYPDREVWGGVTPAKKVEIARTVGNRVAAADPAVIKASVRFSCQDEAILVANSEGALVEDRRPMTYIYATCTARKGDAIESNSFSRAWRSGIERYTPELLRTVASEAVRRTMVLFDARVPGAGEMPVVLGPATSGILLHEAMGHGFEADFNRKGTSIFASMMGEKVAEPFVTIVDTGLVPGARGAVAVDDEGTPGQSTALVEDGVLVSYLHDRISAAHYGVERTGNGRRESFRFPPLPRMRVTTMESGPHDPEEIVRSVSRGIYAVDFANGQVSIGAGDYSFYVKTGFLIEDGKLTAPVKDVNLIGNGPQSLARTVMVGDDKAVDEGTWTCGKDGQSVPVGLGLPTIKVSSISVGGRE